MLQTIANIAFFLVALAMTALILMQRGQGATAGSCFGAGASATVFGARGSANFLSRATAVLATIFMLVSLGMAMYASRNAKPAAPAEDLGVMGQMEVPAEVPRTPMFEVPVVPAGEVPMGAEVVENVEPVTPVE
jgi:preprotein translocase subunit SecG